jgi:hypothetical protein
MQKNITLPPFSDTLGVDLSANFRYTNFQQQRVTVFYQAKKLLSRKLGYSEQLRLP